MERIAASINRAHCETKDVTVVLENVVGMVRSSWQCPKPQALRLCLKPCWHGPYPWHYENPTAKDIEKNFARWLLHGNNAYCTHYSRLVACVN